MRLILSLIFLCVLTPNINCFYEFLSTNPIKSFNFLEKGILEPLVYDRETQDKNDDRYFEEDSISEISPAKLEALNELAEDLPSDNAYFAPQREQETLDKDYFEAPKRSYKSQRHLESREQQDEDSSENFETVQLSSIENNPLESFLESMVNPDSESEDSEENKYENRVVKRVYVLPDETTESSEEPRPRMGLIDLLTNRENRFDSSEYSNVPEYDSNEQEQILMLTPARTNIWDLEEQDLPRRELYETPSIGLIDLLTQSKRYGYDYNPEFETRRQQRTFILSPKRSHMWIDEEKIASPYDDSDSPSLLEKLVNNDDLVPITSNENPQIEKIKSDLQQEEEKFIDTLHENQSTDKKFQMVDNSAELSSKDSVSLQQVSDMNDQKNFIQIKLNKNIERHEAEDLLSFISQLTAVDSSLIKDLSVKENSIWFRLDGLDNRKDLELFIQETLNHEQQIKQEKGLTIVEFNLVNNPEIVEKRKLANSEQTAKKYFLITIATCGSVFAILITLLSIFVIRRRAYLRNKLINELNLPKKKNFDDVERLVEGDYEQSNKFTKFLSKLCSSKQKCDTLESNDSTPNKDTEKILSRQSHQDYQDLCRSEEFVPTHLMTTPVTTNTEMTRKSNADGSNRSSTSS